MKKYYGFIIIIITLAIFFTGCGKKTPDELGAAQSTDSTNNSGDADNPPSLTGPVNEGDESNDTKPPVIDHEADVPPIAGMGRSRITNEWVDAEVAATRPIAMIVPNSKTASQYGLSRASILYECNVEGSMTRLMGIWDDWSGMDKIGNIRSTRDYFVYWSNEWDAIFIHYGGPFYADDILNNNDTQNIDCLRYNNASYRDNAKNTTDNAFTSSEMILKSIEYYRYPLTYRDNIASKPHFSFAEPGKPNALTQYANAVNASTIDMSSTYPVTNCYFKFNQETGLYERFQHLSGETDGPHLDLMNGEQLAFKNVIIQNTYYEQRDQQGYLAFRCHDTSRSGWFFTNGKGIPITWEKISDEPTRYYDNAGNPIELNTGKTMILIIQDGDSFIVDGKKTS